MSEKQQLLFQNQNQSEKENKIIEYDNIKYLINEEENRSGVIGCEKNLQQIHILRSIKQGTKEFNITHIMENAFKSSKIESIRFSLDSKLETIDKNAFSLSTIKRIIIPSSVTLIGEGAFYYCNQLEVIEIPNDSKLQTIGKEAFFYSQIKRIIIPSSVTLIGEGAFFSCNQLEIIEIPNDSKLETIGKNAFSFSTIKSIIIPSSVTLIGKGAFYYCRQLEVIEIPNDSKLQTIGKNAFFYTQIKRIRIPSSVTLIGEGAFYYCNQLEVIEIPNDSKLQTIGKNAFFYTKIKRIRIPSELVDLKKGWCNGTSNLTEIIVSLNNPRYCLYNDNMILGKTRKEENNYENLIFCSRNIKHIKIPNFIKHICSFSFDYCNQLETIEISSDSKLETIEENAFSWSIIKSITIPSSVTLIGEFAFSNCEQLQIIEINSKEMISMCQSHFKDCKNAILMIPVDF